MAKAEIPQLTALRGLAALSIVVFHAYVIYDQVPGLWRAGEKPPTFNHGWVAVDLFFVLSGFLLAGPWVTVPERALSARRLWIYFRRRMVRILPAYYAAFGVAVAMLLAKSRFGVPPAPPFDPPPFSLDAIWTHVTFTHVFWPETIFSVNPVYWTLGIEMQLYVVLPFLAAALARWPRTVLAVSLATALATRYWSWGSPVFMLGVQLPAFLWHFALGILAALLLDRRARIPLWLETNWGTLAILLVAVPLATVAPGDYLQASTHRVETTFVRPALATGFALLVLFSARAGLARSSIPLQAPLLWLGKVSYSLYLIHLPVLYFCWWALSWGFAVFTLVGIGLSLAAAWLVFRLFEKPGLDLLATGWPRDHENPKPAYP